MYKIILQTEAKEEINSIRDWYNLRKAGLGNTFRKLLKIEIEKLKFNPKICENKYQNIRCLSFHKFPYLVHYFIDETSKTVNIVSIFHTSRNPNIWLEDI